ncbi:MAG: insulinase family protein [Verrucomicrobia bacterium]|nr:insulinase family protein [Verrucomicrobiota bacterium]MDI9382256.1 pitrilysin family protein [Verrucomicrobiota bacterium]HOA62247.1 pitrilysin family protein [Verrucomicrobiota bacterium]HOF49622.1 pitrilysin family protein [Verrucomicrobiota bacterium]HOR72661.1 pitrilysin family protein [Verrucomicrobiota bacterium]
MKLRFEDRFMVRVGWRASFKWVAFAACMALMAPLRAQQVPVIEKTLPNGMRLLMVERHDEPTVSGAWVAHVGSSNERPGLTGIAHLFEHMMFKGTPTIGTKDYSKDLEIIAAQERVREEMRREEAKLRAAYRRGDVDDLQKIENRSERLKELDKEFQELIEQQRQILVKNEFDRVYTTAGASGMNAFTSEDMTAYFITVPANKLELWMWMESERLWRPVFREFYAERDVVYEERRLRTESTPLGKFQESFMAMFWDASTYNWPVIGWPADLPTISKAQADEFYGTYYAPQNITLILVGDFKATDAEPLALRYFGRIPRGAREAPDVVTWEPPQPAEKRMLAEAETNPQVDILWHTVPFGHKDSYALDVLARILSTRTGRLYKGLVLGSQVATEVYAQQDARKWAGLFNAGGEAKEGHTPEEVEQAIYAEIEKLKEAEVPDQELQKVKNNFAASEYRKLTSNLPILFQLIVADGLGNWREINEAAPKYQAVTAADVKRVARVYFTRENRAVAIYVRKPGTGGEDPDLAELNADQKKAAQAMVGRIRSETDAKKLRENLDRVEAQLAQLSAEVKPLLDFLKKKMQERLTQIETK